MKRDLKRAIQQYDRLFADRPGTAGKIYTSDVEQIRKISGKGLSNVVLYNAICYALKAGFIIGYRCKADPEDNKQ